jgi:serine phosphatase RsbU (regulator of sigma subunit)
MDPEEELYGVPRLRAVLQGKTDLPLDEIQKTVLESVENFARGARQGDDVTILVVRYRMVANGVTEAGVPSGKSAAAND